MTFRAQAATRKNRLGLKPNEDKSYFNSTAGLACIADGVSRFSSRADGYPSPSLGEYASGELVNKCQNLAETAAAVGLPISLDDLNGAFRTTSEALRQFVSQNGPFDLYEHDYPGTVGTVIATTGRELRWAHLGDTAMILIGRYDGRLLTRDQVAGFRMWLRSNSNDLPTDMADRIRYVHSHIRNNASVVHSYGVLTGESAALSFVETGACTIAPEDRIILATDGLEPLWGVFKWNATVPGAAPNALVDCLRKSTPEALLDMAEQAEIKHSTKSDDKTVVVIDLLR